MRFDVTEKARKVASLEAMVIDFEHMALELTRQISSEEEYTHVKDPAHVAYSTFAKATRLRRTKLLDSVADLHDWLLRGDVDLLRLERPADGMLHVLIGDMKSTTEVKVEHRLQVAFYRLMLERLLKDAGINHAPVQTGILFRPPADPTPEEEGEIRHRGRGSAG